MTTSKTYNFTLILSGIIEPTQETEDALFEANCDDAVLFFRDRTAYLEFDREASSFEDAVISAIKDVEKAEIHAQPIRVEPSDLVTAAEIARRLDRSRESIRQLIAGERGLGDFPQPIAGVTTNTLIWSWAEVTNWFFNNKKLDNYEVVEAALFIRHCNEALDLRGKYLSLDNIKRIVAKLNDFDKVSDSNPLS